MLTYVRVVDSFTHVYIAPLQTQTFFGRASLHRKVSLMHQWLFAAKDRFAHRSHKIRGAKIRDGNRNTLSTQEVAHGIDGA